MKVLVVGAGTMGHGIAEVFSFKNYVYIYDSYPQALSKGLENIKWSLNKLKEKGIVKDVDVDLGKNYTIKGIERC